MTSFFDPTKWYWTIGGDQSRVFSSAAGDYVSLSDPTFVAWLAAGNVPAANDTEAALGVYLAPFLARPVLASALDGYQSGHADGIVSLVMFKVLFNHENRIRALEGKAALSVAQARNAIKALM